MVGAVKEPILRAISFELTLVTNRANRDIHVHWGNLPFVFICQVNNNIRFLEDEHWNHVSASIFNGGGIRTSIDEQSRNGAPIQPEHHFRKTVGNFLFNQRKTALKRVGVSSAGSITMEDLISVLPFGGTFDLVQLKGSTLRKAFEHSVKRYGHSTGEFLQVSGIFHFISVCVLSSIFRLLTELMPFFFHQHFWPRWASYRCFHLGHISNRFPRRVWPLQAIGESREEPGHPLHSVSSPSVRTSGGRGGLHGGAAVLHDDRRGRVLHDQEWDAQTQQRWEVRIFFRV